MKLIPAKLIILAIACLLTTSAALGAVTFTRVDAGDAGTDPGHYYSICWGDYDGDGFVDLFAGFYTMFTASEPSRLYHNNRDGTFTRILSGGIADDAELSANYAISAAWADFENDGDLDLYVTQTNLGPQPSLADLLYLNNGDGTFVRAGQDWIPANPGMDMAWGDYDNDGLIDLFVADYSDGTSLLYHHQPDGSMLPSDFYVVEPDKNTFTSLWSDIDLDGDVDLLIGSLPVLWRNDNGVFTQDFEVLQKTPWAYGTADYDNDGDLDLAVVSRAAQNNQLFQNNAEAGWVEVAGSPIAISEDTWTFGAALWGDYDNDGYVDLLIPTFTRDEQLQGPIYNEPNMLFHNEGDGTFTRVLDGPLVTDIGASWSGGWADYDNDGDLDIALADGQNAGPNYQLPAAPVALYQNNGGNDNNWLNLTLVGTISNRSAIGAKVFAYAQIDGAELQQMREVKGGDSHRSQSDMRVHFGLGDATVVDTLRIEWPSGGVQFLHDVTANQFLSIEEDFLTWADYPVKDESMNVDTGDFMGWINAWHADYVYSYSLSKYIYCPESHVSDDGAWVYVMR